MPIPQQSHGLKKQSARDRIYSLMREWIIEGVLVPGERLSDEDLSKHFNVSRTPVREAIQLLEIQNLVRVIPGRATVVAEMDLGNVRSYYLPLMVLHSLAAELACENITDGQIAHLKGLNRRFQEAKESGGIKEVITADEAFHNEILRIAGNESIIDFSAILCTHIHRAEYQFVEATRKNQQNVTAHDEIIAALAARDRERSGRLMKENWLRTMNFFEENN